MSDRQLDRNWLVYRASLPTEMRKGAVGKVIVEYLEALGYIQIQSKPSLQFERGSVLGGLSNPDPRGQRAELTADVISMGGNHLVEVVLRVNRLGTVTLGAHDDFWQAELNGLQNALTYGYADPLASHFAAERAKWLSVSLLLATLLILLMTIASIVFVVATVANPVPILY